MSNTNPSKSRMERRKRKRKLRKRVYFMIIPLFVVLALGISVFWYVNSLYQAAETTVTESHEKDEREGEKSELREEKVDPEEDNVSVLIIGVDTSDKRQNVNGLSDTLILATLNKENKSIKLLSIPRDSLVYIPEVGYETKINHAHSYGGATATVETVENLLDVPIDYYFRLNFEAFIDVVDAIGGIEVEVPYEIWEQDSRDVAGAIHLLPGLQELNGEEALALARTRKYDNDIERGKRQQEIIKAVLKKSISLGSLFKYDDILEAVGENMKTSMTFNEMKSFISYGTSGSNLSIETLTLLGYDYNPGDAYYYKLDEAALEETKQTLKDHLELED